MTKSKWIVVVVLAGALITVGAFKRTSASNDQPTQGVQNQDPHQHHQQQVRKPLELPALLVDGATNPHAVPDLIAYEFLFNSIADGAGTTEPDRIRAKVFVQKTGLDEQKNQKLVATANSLREAVVPLKAQAKDLKDRHWPTPSQSVMAQLNNLQRQKETILKERFNSLMEQLNTSDREKLNKRVLEIKSKVKIYPSIPVEKFQKK